MGHGQLGQIEGAGDVETHRSVERPLARVEEGRGQCATDVVDDDVEPPELGDGGVDEGLHAVAGREVAGDRRRSASVRLDRRCGIGELVGGTGTGDDIGTGLGQTSCHGGADSSTGAGDDGNPIIETKAVEHHGLNRRLCERCLRPSWRQPNDSTRF